MPVNNLCAFSPTAYVQKQYSATAKTVLIDAINDKCANYRRKKTV
jgi:hypothetical protein